MIGDYSCIRCITNWGAILNVKGMSGNSVWVSDPNAVDAGQCIGADEIQTMWKISLYKDFPHGQHSNEYWAKNSQYY